MNFCKMIRKPISSNIPLNVYEIIDAIHFHQRSPWNYNLGNNYDGVEILTDLWKYMNSGVPEEYFFYKGDLYRIHCPNTTLIQYIDKENETIVGKVWGDGSCSVLPKTHYDDYPISFSKSYDFTKPVYYKVVHSKTSIINHINTKDKYGIDVNAIMFKYDFPNLQVVEEQEIMFPMMKDYVVKEYKCSPNQFLYYMRNKGDR